MGDLPLTAVTLYGSVLASRAVSSLLEKHTRRGWRQNDGKRSSSAHVYTREDFHLSCSEKWFQKKTAPYHQCQHHDLQTDLIGWLVNLHGFRMYAKCSKTRLHSRQAKVSQRLISGGCHLHSSFLSLHF